MNPDLMYQGKNVLITGGLGFLGSSLAHRLAGLGAKVTLLDALIPLYGGNRFNIRGIEDKVELLIGDIRDGALLKKIIPGKDFIFNFAAQVSYIDSGDMPLEDLDINCIGHLRVLEECRINNPGAKILFSSSRMALGAIVKNPVDEQHPTEPLSIYGIHKLTGEKYYLAYHKHYGLKTVVMRITNPYGTRQQVKHNKYSLIGWFIRMAMEGKEIQVFGEGRQMRDYIYVDDIVEAFLLAGATPKSDGQLFNLGSGVSTPFSEMVNTVVRVVGRGSVKNIPWPANYERIETGDFVMDISKLYKIIQWSHKVNLEEGIRKTFEYLEMHKGNYF